MIKEKESTDFLNKFAKEQFYSVLEEEMQEYIEKNKDRILAETLLKISRHISIERFGDTVRFEIKTDSNK